MRITNDAEVDAAYIYLTKTPLMPGRDSIPVDPPDGVSAMVVLDWKDGRIVGLEVLAASKVLHEDLLAEAQRNARTEAEQHRWWEERPGSALIRALGKAACLLEVVQLPVAVVKHYGGAVWRWERDQRGAADGIRRLPGV